MKNMVNKFILKLLDEIEEIKIESFQEQVCIDIQEKLEVNKND